MAVIDLLISCTSRLAKKKLDSYVDPTSGYRVFTSQYLEKREDCCGCACRHCPLNIAT